MKQINKDIAGNKEKITDRTFNFAVNIVKYCDELFENKKYDIGRQLLRSGTSIGANTIESQRAVSKADFINKLSIALKESDETAYWLTLISSCYSEEKSSTFLLCKEAKEISAILKSIILNTRKNMNSVPMHRETAQAD